ncbi:hypothetical protein BDZ89DRAFT_1115656 [Hymenopellis radicata]|nr:hypothetical protein BDZ89DRAFT_1115656 [Hymenopellis radicata]
MLVVYGYGWDTCYGEISRWSFGYSELLVVVPSDLQIFSWASPSSSLSFSHLWIPGLDGFQQPWMTLGFWPRLGERRQWIRRHPQVHSARLESVGAQTTATTATVMRHFRRQESPANVDDIFSTSPTRRNPKNGAPLEDDLPRGTAMFDSFAAPLELTSAGGTTYNRGIGRRIFMRRTASAKHLHCNIGYEMMGRVGELEKQRKLMYDPERSESYGEYNCLESNGCVGHMAVGVSSALYDESRRRRLCRRPAPLSSSSGAPQNMWAYQNEYFDYKTSRLDSSHLKKASLFRLVPMVVKARIYDEACAMSDEETSRSNIFNDWGEWGFKVESHYPQDTKASEKVDGHGREQR